METIVKYKKTNVKLTFKDVKDKECFYSGNVLYMKILRQDLDSFEIKNVNAISIINAGLTNFDSDEIVVISTKEF